MDNTLQVNDGTSPMEHAIAEAMQALGKVSPNPAVGAVVVKDGRIVGRGHTQPPGGHHAEVMALRDAGTSANHAILYVTMEPCPHTGRTPPCTNAIRDAGIREVRIATLDPNPRTNGTGVSTLQASGIKVHVGECARRAQEIIEGFAKYVQTKIPFAIAKFAISLNGEMVTGPGESKWISGEESRKMVHIFRSQVDAVMVGIGTAITDDPRLTIRIPEVPVSQQPLRVVVDSYGRLSPTSAMLNEPGATLVAVSKISKARERSLTASGAEVIRLPSENGERVDLTALMRVLGEKDITSILIEGGPTLHQSVFRLKLADKVIVFVGPVLINTHRGIKDEQKPTAPMISNLAKVQQVTYEQIGEDVMIVGYMNPSHSYIKEG